MLTTFIMPITILSTWSAVVRNVKEFMVFMLIPRDRDGRRLPRHRPLPLLHLLGAGPHPDVLPDRRVGGERRIYAAIKFFLYTFVGSVLMLVAIIVLYFHHHAVTGSTPWTS